MNRALDELAKVNGNTEQAVRMADEATKKGDATKALEYTNAAEAFANRLIALEAEIEEQKTLTCRPPRPPIRPSTPSSRTPPPCRRSSASVSASSVSSTRRRCRSR